MKAKRYITTRNQVAVSAQFRQAGAHGGGKRERNRRDRQAAKRFLKGGTNE